MKTRSLLAVFGNGLACFGEMLRLRGSYNLLKDPIWPNPKNSQNQAKTIKNKQKQQKTSKNKQKQTKNQQKQAKQSKHKQKQSKTSETDI